MKRLPGLLLLAGVVVGGACGSAVATENNQDHSQGVAADATGGASGVSGHSDPDPVGQWRCRQRAVE